MSFPEKRDSLEPRMQGSSIVAPGSRAVQASSMSNPMRMVKSPSLESAELHGGQLLSPILRGNT